MLACPVPGGWGWLVQPAGAPTCRCRCHHAWRQAPCPAVWPAAAAARLVRRYLLETPPSQRSSRAQAACVAADDRLSSSIKMHQELIHQTRRPSFGHCCNKPGAIFSLPSAFRRRTGPWSAATRADLQQARRSAASSRAAMACACSVAPWRSRSSMRRLAPADSRAAPSAAASASARFRASPAASVVQSRQCKSSSKIDLAGCLPQCWASRSHSPRRVCKVVQQSDTAADADLSVVCIPANLAVSSEVVRSNCARRCASCDARRPFSSRSRPVAPCRPCPSCATSSALQW